MPETLVPDTSVLVDGRITELIEGGEYDKPEVHVPLAALSELEAQANRGLETGFSGLDELSKLQRLAAEGRCTVRFVGDRPSGDEIERAHTWAIDARIRDAAVASDALFVTSDRVAAHAAAAQGVRHHYLRPMVEDMPHIEQLRLTQFFDDDTMSVHLKADCQPMAKKGTPGAISYEPVGTKAIPHKELRGLIKECIEFAKRDYNSFIELERHGCTVVQMGPMRVTIAQPPFSDGLEVTAVRPVIKTSLTDYDLPAPIRERLEGRARGVLIAGPPGSGKSTFATAVAEHLHGLGRVVKTMEQPRDLQLPKEITQYGALDKDMAGTGEVMLLVRPDHVVYDEVRTTNDYIVFADMRLAGVGLFGVTHANRPIDAVQRLIGRIDLGMIPQVVDTIVFIDEGAISGILELRFTVKVPEGMVEADLARPVVLVRDVTEQKDIFELYTYGEQIVVMPIGADGPGGGRASPQQELAERELRRSLQRHVQGHFEVDLRGDRATVYVEEWEVPAVIGKGGRTVQSLERKLGIRLDIRALEHEPPEAKHAAPLRPEARRTGKNVFLFVGDAFAGQDVLVEAGDATIGGGTASNDGKLRFKAASPEGKALLEAMKRGVEIVVRRN